MKNLFFFLILLNSPNLFAQFTDWKFYSEATSILTITQDNDNIWVGSYVGAMKLNKNTGIKTYYDKTNAPIPDSWISQIAVDNNGVKWMGTWTKGNLLKFDDVNWIVYDTSNSPLPGCAIVSLAIDSSNSIWLSTGCTNHGLYKFNGTDWTVYDTSNSSIPSNYIVDILCDANTIWIATNFGLAKFDGANWTVYDASNSNYSNDAIVKIEKDSFGNIWLLHYNGVEKFDGTSFYIYNNSNTNFPNVNSFSLAIDANNIIWTGCISNNLSPQVLGGIMSFDGNTWTKYDTSNSQITDTGINPVFVDNSNTLWFGCAYQGILGNKNGSAWATFDPSTAGLDQGYVRQIVHDFYGNAFIGTTKPSTGFSLFKYNWNSWTGLPYYNSSSYGIAADKSGNFYIKNPSGLKKFDGTNWYDLPDVPPLLTNFPVNLKLNSLNLDISGEIWMDYVDRVDAVFDPITEQWNFQVQEGLAHYNGNNWSTFSSLNSPIPGSEINDIITDNDNNIWVGTNNGLIKYDGVNWAIYNTSNSSLPTNYIYSFVIDTSGNIWLPNGHYGLYKFDLVNTINYHHPTLDQFSINSLIYIDIDGTIWQRTLFELFSFDGTNWSAFNADNSPIPNNSNVTSLSIDKYGNKWIGTHFGFLAYKKNGVITSIATKPILHIPVSAFPNPFIESFDIDLGKQMVDIQINVFDLLSHNVYSSHFVQAKRIKIPRKNLSSGTYYYQVVSGKKIIANGKIIAE
jgi:ligand-binding sensor domain-containing protein